MPAIISDKISHSRLSPIWIQKRILPRYDLSSDALCSYFQNGLSETYRVTAKRRYYYLKLYRRSWRTRRQIESEVDLLRFLERRKARVCQPIVRNDNKWLSGISVPEGGLRYAVLFAGAPGGPPDLTDTVACQSFGAAVGRLHQAAQGYQSHPTRPSWHYEGVVKSALRQLGESWAGSNRDFRWLLHVGEAVVEALHRQGPLPEGICHGDLHRANVHEDSRGALRIFDFDLSGEGPLAYDLAVYKWSEEISSQAGQRTLAKRWNSFIKGYEKSRALSRRERSAIELLVFVRHLWALGSQPYTTEFRGEGYFNPSLFSMFVSLMKKRIENSPRELQRLLVSGRPT